MAESSYAPEKLLRMSRFFGLIRTQIFLNSVPCRTFVISAFVATLLWTSIDSPFEITNRM
jgi:hypothetical protein